MWKVVSEYMGKRRRISDIQKYLKTKFSWLQMIFLVFKHQKNIHIEFICISEVAVGIITRLHNKFIKAICTLARIDCVNPKYATQLLIFLSNCNFDYHLDLALFINNGGRTWKQNNSNTTATFHEHLHQLCLRTGNVCHLCKISVLTHNIFGWSRHKIKKINTFRKNWLASNIEPCQHMQAGGRKYYKDWRMSLTPTDQIKQQTVSVYVQEAIWPGNKILPKNWSK